MWWLARAVIRRSVSVHVSPMSRFGGPFGCTYCHIASVLAPLIPAASTTPSCRFTTSAGRPSLKRRLTLSPKKPGGGGAHVAADATEGTVRHAHASAAASLRRLQSIVDGRRASRGIAAI